MQHVLVVAGARDVGPILRRLRPELHITAMVATQRLAKVRHPEHCARVLALDEAAPTAEWVSLAGSVHHAEELQGIAAFGEFDQDKAAAIAVALGLPFHPGSVIARVYDKALMRRRLRQAGVEDVPAAVVDTVEGLEAFVAAHGFPLILKPVRGTGSRGVVRLASRADLPGAFAVVAGASGEACPVLAEPYLEGVEVSVEAFSEDGAHRVLGVTDKLVDEAFIEIGHVVREAGPDDAALARHVTRALHALGITYGPTHTEVKLTPTGPRVVETHTRAGGDRIPQLLHAVSGIDMIELAARQALGERVMPELDERLGGAPSSRVGVVRYAAPPRAGTLASVRHVGTAGSVPLVTGCTVLKEPGATLVLPMRDSRDRVAYCTAVADDRAAALDAAETALARLEIDVEAG